MPGMKIMDIGCGPGFFTLPMAELTGKDGLVIAVDIQDEMLKMSEIGVLRQAYQRE